MPKFFFVFFTLLVIFVGNVQAKEVGYPGDLTYKGLKNIIDAANPSSVENLLSLLPKEYLANFTLVYESHSLQGASFLNPRVILFGKQGKLIMTFNGESGQKNYSRVEVIHFDESESRFHFKTLSFDSNSKSHVKIDGNQNRCIVCHGKVEGDLHPLWHNWPDHHGIYAGLDDSFVPRSDDINDLHPERAKLEYENYKEFLKSKDSNSRYRYLKFDSSNPNAPYIPYPTTAFKGPYSRNLKMRPNLRLTFLLTRLQAKRVARMIREGAEMKKLDPFHYLKKYDDGFWGNEWEELGIDENEQRLEFNFGSNFPDGGFDTNLPYDGGVSESERKNAGVIFEELVESELSCQVTGHENLDILRRNSSFIQRVGADSKEEVSAILDLTSSCEKK